MPNNLCVALAQNKTTFDNCRLFLFNLLGKDKHKVIELENSSIEVCIPYYIAYLEYKGIDFLTAINFFHYEYPTLTYYDLQKVAIINTFRKVENNDYNFIPF